MRILLLIFITLLLSSYSFAQSRKKADKNNLKTETVWEQDDKGIKKKESYTRFDKDGNTIEEIEFDETGTKMIKHITYIVNSDNDLIEERQYTPANKLAKTIKYKYNDDGKVIQEDHILATGKIEKIVKYKYDDKIKLEKNTFDAAGKLRKKKTYVYERYED